MCGTRVAALVQRLNGGIRTESGILASRRCLGRAILRRGIIIVHRLSEGVVLTLEDFATTFPEELGNVFPINVGDVAETHDGYRVMANECWRGKNAGGSE